MAVASAAPMTRPRAERTQPSPPSQALPGASAPPLTLMSSQAPPGSAPPPTLMSSQAPPGSAAPPPAYPQIPLCFCARLSLGRLLLHFCLPAVAFALSGHPKALASPAPSPHLFPVPRCPGPPAGIEPRILGLREHGAKPSHQEPVPTPPCKRLLSHTGGAVREIDILNFGCTCMLALSL